MRGKLLFTALAVAILAVFASMSLAGAESINHKGRTVYHFNKVEVIKVGDVSGHIVGVAEGSGLNSLDNGEVAAYSNKITFDYVDGSGTFEGYGVNTYEDGSVTVVKAQGTTTALPGGKVSLFKGTYSFLKGTGRFEGIKGSGSLTGKRIVPIGAGAECFMDTTETYTLPTR